MVLKLIGALMTIISFTALGLYFSNEMKLRLSQMKELKKYITILRGEIRYGATPLPEAIKELSLRSQGVFHNFFHVVSKQLQSGKGGTFRDIWTYHVENNLYNTSLSDTDKERFIQFGENLGYLDKQMQLNTIDMYVNQLQEEITEQTKSVKERTRIYNLLGLMTGLFLTIIMI